LKIGVDNYLLFIEKSKNLKENDSTLDEYESFKLFEENQKIKTIIGEHFVISVIFLSMFLESYIYDFSARNQGDSFTSKFLDKLDTISKWIIIPKIISGVEIDRSRKSFETFKKLIRTRNKLIHWKSKDANIAELYKNRENEIYNLIDLKEVFLAIKDIFQQLENGQEIKVHKFYIKYIDENKICG